MTNMVILNTDRNTFISMIPNTLNQLRSIKLETAQTIDQI